jgi:uncharacterized protein YjbI with pentapeptide repeats
MGKCAYCGKRIRKIEMEWMEKNVKDENEKMFLKMVLESLGENANCRFDAIPGKELCIFHDPDYWREHPDEVREEFLKHLKEDEERFFIGFHLPSIIFPKIVEKDARIELAKFHGTLDAVDTIFKGSARFNGATFKGLARFNGATFKRLAGFYGAIFEGLARFDGATFEELAGFYGATFERLAGFNGATFKGLTWFYGATFKRRAEFEKAEFFGRTSFEYSVFLRQVTFKDSIFLPDLLEKCLDLYSCILFRRSDFKKPEKVVFDGCRMKKVSFIHTDIRRIRFRNVDWGEDFRIFDEKLLLIRMGKEKEVFLKECVEKLQKMLKVLDGKKRYKEVEREIEFELRTPEILTELDELKGGREKIEEKEKKEEKLKELKENLRERIKKSIDNFQERREKLNEIFKEVEKDDDLTLDNVLAVYRALRDNCDYHLRYEESGRFFINEMRLRRIVGREHDGEKPHGLGGIKTRLSDIAERVVMWFYEVLALYGESYARPILWAILLIFSSSLIRPLWLWVQNLSWRPELSFMLEQVKTSILVFFQLQWDTRTLTIVERLLSIPILGTLVLALRRKLERRVRH